MEGIVSKDIRFGGRYPEVQRYLLYQLVLIDGGLAGRGLGGQTALEVLLESALEDLAGA